MEDCVQGALSSLYPPFESTAPPLLSQVFSVLESTYQHDSLRYLLDYFVPAKHLLHKLQQHACSQYLGCLFLHSGWPLCLGEKVVVQLSTLDWRLLRSNDFYLQVVPFSTRCPRLALKCLAPGGRTVQEILVPESQHPLVFTTEWLHSVNKERGHKREVGGGLDTCLVSTCDGVVRLPWKEVVYPKFIHDPSEELGLMSNHEGRLPSEGGSSLGGWGGSSSGELDSWSWDEEEDESLPPDGLDSAPALPRRRRSEDGLGRTTRHPQLDGDYVELLEPRVGPDGGVDTRQRYLEMHGICKTKTLPLCRRGKAIKLRKGRAWGYGRLEGSGSFRSALGTKRDMVTPKGDILPPRPPAGATVPGRGRQSYSSSVHDSDEGDKTSRDSEGLESHRLYFDGPFKERRPGVGKERDSNGLTQPCRDDLRCKDSESGDSLVTNEIHDLNHKVGRKRKGKGAKGRARSGGRAYQKGSKQPGKASQPSPTASSTLTKLSVTENKQSEQREQADQPDGAPPSTNEATEDTGKGNAETGAESLPVCNGQSGTSLFNHSTEEAGSAETCPDQLNGVATKEPPLLRELDTELLQSGKLKLTGTVDRLGRALIITETDASEGGFCEEEMARVLACYHRITRPAAKEKGLTVLMDSRRSPPSPLCLSALKLFQVLVPGGLGSVLVLVEEQQESLSHNLEGAEIHTVRGTGVLQQYVDKQQLPEEMDGDFAHCHSDWLVFRLSLESLTERCESALSLLGEALQSMDAEPMPDNIKAVPLSIDKHRQLMVSVLADQRLTELQQRGGAWLAGLTNSTSGLAQKSPDCRAALAATSKLYDSVDDALHRLVRVSNQRGRDLEALGRLAGLVDKLEKCDKEIEQVQSQLDNYKDPPLSLSRLSLKQQKFKTFRETANIRLPPVREKLRDMSHCLSDCWTTLDNTQRLLSTLTEATQWCDAVSSTSSSPSSSSSTCPLASLPPIPPSRFQDARSLAIELGGGALLDLWTQTVERYQRTVAQVKPRFLQSDRGQNQGQGKPKTPSASSLWDLMGTEGEGDWGLGVGGSDGGMQSWGSLASLFRPQTCSTLKIGEEKGNKKEGGGGGSGGGGAGGGVLIRGVEVSSKEVVDHTGSPRQHVLLGRTERETGTDRAGSTAQSKLYLLWCRMLSSERQYVAVLKGVEETYLPLLELSDTPASIRGKADALFPNWASLSSFHSQNLLPAMEGALVQSLLQQDCFSKYREQFLQYSHYIRTKLELDSPLITQAADFFKSKLPPASPLSPLSFPHCLQAPTQRLEQYCEALEELGGINPASDSALSILRHAQRHGEDLRASDLIVGCPIPVAERGELVRQGELTVCGGARRKRAGVRNVFLYQHVVIFTKQKSPAPGRVAYSYKQSIKTGEMGLTQSVGEEGVKFEVWVRQAPRTRDCITLQAKDREDRVAWTHDVAHLLWTHAINNTGTA
ncbi:Rho guanine nucleotide exchange factor 40 [Collichthys lucidus]|uniref:Rho guanine nucleotide exchange factor 40 n=1 Tax=Collichthys lucidus TaxID=240159 RepID=A0A4U5VZX5_COLLU|nr:Rho guanine nucleotide exchange factor 40 [Collichthys lucidus]